MKTFLSLCVLVAAAVACPASDKCCPCACSDSSVTSTKTISSSSSSTTVISSTNYPAIVPATWKVKTFDSQYATQAFQGPWYLQAASPTVMRDLIPSRTGLFNTQLPCCCNRVIFKDTTPNCPYDFNTDYYMIDSSFNMFTQKLETTKTVFKSAYGPDSSLAIFNVGTEEYYPSPIAELKALVDEKLFKHPCGDEYKRDYTIAMIGADDSWSEYMVFTVLNTYDNIFSGNDGHFIWMFTRDANPTDSTYKKAYDDIMNSGLSPRYLMSVDQSIDLSTIPTVTKDDLEGVIETSVTTSSTAKSISSDSDSTSVSSTSTTSTTTVVSTIDVPISPDFTIPYEYDTYDLFGDIKILKNLKPELIREALNGKYYVQMATPCMCDQSDGSRAGLLYTTFPTNSLQVLFDDTDTNPWDYNTPTMMLDRAYNAITGELQQTRSMITSSFDGSTPYNVFTVYTEGYYPNEIPELSPLCLDGMIAKSPGKLYKHQYIASIVGYEPNKYLLYTIANKFKNLMYGDNDSMNQLYVCTRDRIIPKDLINTINQDILRSGYNLRYLSSIDQTRDITDTFTFESSYFEYTVTTTSKSVSVEGVTVASSSSSSVSSSSSSTVPVCSDSCGC